MRTYFFKQFLNHFWLRPENALLLAIRAESYYKTLDLFGTEKDTIDVSCGDGVYSFITLGGQLSSSTDMFTSVKIGQREGDFDAFDHFDSTYSVEIVKQAEKTYGYGLDWKNNLLHKAEKLQFYKNLIHHDNNFTIPLPDESMKYIYTNSAYWVENFSEHLKDLARLLQPGGHLVLQIKTDNIRKLSATNYASEMGETFHKIIDAGRMSTWKGLRSKDEVLSILRSIDGVKITHIEPIYGDIAAIIWDIGLRPLFNPLVKMANNLTDSQRVEIKEEWNDIFYNLFEEFLLEPFADF